MIGVTMNQFTIGLILSSLIYSGCMLKVKQTDLSSNEISVSGAPVGLNNKTSFDVSYECPSCDRLIYKVGLSSDTNCENMDGYVSLANNSTLDLTTFPDGEMKLCLKGYKKNSPNVVFYSNEYIWTKDTEAPSIAFSIDEGLFSDSLTTTADIEISTDDGSEIPSDVVIEYCVGEAPGECTMQDWMTLSTAQNVNSKSLSISSKMNTNKLTLTQALQSGKIYYTSARLKDSAGNTSTPVSGPGWKATEAATFTQLCFNANVNDVYQDSENKLAYYVGDFTQVGLCANQMALYNEKARLDGQKQNAWSYIDGTVMTAIADPSGGWYIGGQFTITGHSGIRNLARINLDMTIDSNFTFALGNTVEYSEVRKLAIDGDYLYVGGDFSQVNSNSNHYNLFRLNRNTKSLDTSWTFSGYPIESTGSVKDIKFHENFVYVFDTNTDGDEYKGIYKINKSNGLTTDLFGCSFCSDFINSIEIYNNKLYASGLNFGVDCDVNNGCNEYFKNLIFFDLNTLAYQNLTSLTDNMGEITNLIRIEENLYFIENSKLHKFNLSSQTLTTNILPDLITVTSLNTQNNLLVVTGSINPTISLSSRYIVRTYASDLTLVKDYSKILQSGGVAFSATNEFLNYGISSVQNKYRSRFAVVSTETHDVLSSSIEFDDTINKLIKVNGSFVFAGKFQKSKYLSQSIENLFGMLIYNSTQNEIEALNYGTNNSFTNIEALVNHGNMLFFGGNFKFTSTNNFSGSSLIYEDIFSYDLVEKKSKDRSFYTNNFVKTLLVHNNRLFVGGGFTSIRSTSPTTNTTRRYFVSYDLSQTTWPLMNYNSSFTLNGGQIRHIVAYGNELIVEGMYNSQSYFKKLDVSGTTTVSLVGAFNPTLAMTSSTATVRNMIVVGDQLLFYGVFDRVNTLTRDRFAVYDLSTNSLISTPTWMGSAFEGVGNLNMKFVYTNEILYTPGNRKSVDSIPLYGLGVYDLNNGQFK